MMPTISKTKYKDKADDVVFALKADWVSWAHTIAAASAFISAFVVGCSLHYRKIVQNEWFGYPDEWFPSVSAAIGDRYPERSFFMIFIAIASGPRFALVGLWYLFSARLGQSLPKIVALAGLLRTITCGGWTYVTSTDDHNWHDIFMISYLVLTIPWMGGCLATSTPNTAARRWRSRLCPAFFSMLVPLVYFFIQHKVYRVAGAYTKYAFFEWLLIVFDVAFDAATALDFQTFELLIRDIKGTTMGGVVVSAGDRQVGKRKEAEQVKRAVFADAFNFVDLLDVAAGAYHGFVFWSMLTGLGVTIWFFPLWYMGISGFEAFVMSPVGPFLLASKSLRSLATKKSRIAHLASLGGLLAFLMTRPALRLLTIASGVFLSCFAWAGTLHGDSVHPKRLESRVLALTTGLVVSNVVKFAWQTNNPIWPTMHAANGGANWPGFVLAVLAALRFTRPRAVQAVDVPAQTGGSAVLTAFGMGGLFFGLHSLLSDTSTMMFWVWDGFPIHGPVFNVHPYLTIAAMSAGLFLGMFRKDLVTSWLAYGVYAVGAFLLTTRSGWLGYYGALVLATYLVALSVPLTALAAKKKPAVTFGLGFFVYNIMVLFHVWVVAYAFVPGGPLVREHTDWIMTTMTFLLGAGVLDLQLARPNYPDKSRPKKHRQPQASANKHTIHHMAVLALLNGLFIVANYFRFPAYDYRPYHAEERLITAGIWTIHFGLDNDMWSSEHRMRDLIRELELDVVGLLESDCQRIIMGNRDTTQFLAENLGMYVDYGPGPNKHTWGAALLSKFPIVNSTHHLLPSPVGELAPAIEATINAYGTLVDVFVFHSGQAEDREDRRQQAWALSGLMGATPRPSILLSYLVTKPLQDNYNDYWVSERSGMHDVDSTDWDRWCEYILFKGLKRTGYARLSRSTITDTELQVAKFVVPSGDEDQAIAWQAGQEQRNRRVSELEVPAATRFPAMFKGEGRRGHRYHVFDEPRYFDY